MLVVENATTAEQANTLAPCVPLPGTMAAKVDIADSESFPADAAVLASCGSVKWSVLER